MIIKAFHPYPGYAGFNVADDQGGRFVGNINLADGKLFHVKYATKAKYEADTRGGHIRPPVVDGRYVGRHVPVWIGLSPVRLAKHGPKLVALLLAHVARSGLDPAID